MNQLPTNNEFNVGDKVEVTKDFTFEDVSFKEGQTGTVVRVQSKYDISVEWDFTNRNFHSCGGNSRLGNGYNMDLRECFLGNVTLSYLNNNKPGNPLPKDPHQRGICLKIIQMEARFKRKQEQKRLEASVTFEGF